MFYQAQPTYSSSTYNKMKYAAFILAILWAISAYSRHQKNESPLLSLILLSTTLKMCLEAAKQERSAKAYEAKAQPSPVRLAGPG